MLRRKTSRSEVLCHGGLRPSAMVGEQRTVVPVIPFLQGLSGGGMRSGRFRRAVPNGPTTAVFVAGLLACWLAGTPSYGQAKAPERETRQHPLLICTPPLSEADRAVFVALHRKQTVRFSKTPLPKAVETLEKLLGKEVVLDRAALEREGLDPAVPLTVDCKKVPLEVAIWEMFRRTRLDYRVHDGLLEITTRNECMKHLVTRTYPLDDLWQVDEDYGKLRDEFHEAAGLSDWDMYGGLATLKPDKKKRAFTIRHTQSSQDKILRMLIIKRTAARKAKEAAKQ